MSRLSKRQIAAHLEAEALLEKPRLTDDDRQFVLDNWQESANHINSAAGAFFTPSELALCAAIYTSGAASVLDLCAGIGALGLAAHWYNSLHPPKITCVELNPAYVEIGRKLLPEARWICASADRLPDDIGRFDCVISNPPFGNTAKIAGPRYSETSELAVVDIASRLAAWGVFILPSMSCPFEFSGRDHYERREAGKYSRFHAKTGLMLECGSIDCAVYKDAWRGVSPNVEVATIDFDLGAIGQFDLPLFAEAAE